MGFEAIINCSLEVCGRSRLLILGNFRSISHKHVWVLFCRFEGKEIVVFSPSIFYSPSFPIVRMLGRDIELTLRLCNTLQTSAINARHHFYLCARILSCFSPLAFASLIKRGVYVKGIRNLRFAFSEIESYSCLLWKGVFMSITVWGKICKIGPTSKTFSF